MESLESRIARLAPEQQREVEDFVDFLLLKNSIRQAPVTELPAPSPMKAPPVMIPEPAPAVPSSPMQSRVIFSKSGDYGINAEPIPPAPINEIMAGSDDGITRDYLDYGDFDSGQAPSIVTEKKGRRLFVVRQGGDESSPRLDWID